MHAAIADARMWEPIVPWLTGHQPISYDLRGHGQMDEEADGPWHHVDDLLGLLDDEPAVLVGASTGCRVVLEAAVLRGDLVPGLVLLGPLLADWEPSAESAAFLRERERLLAAGDHAGAAALTVRYWVVGPGRAPSAVPRDVREHVTAMQRRALAVQAALGVEERPRVSDLPLRLGEIRAPTLVAVGQHDIPEMHAASHAIVDALDRAEHVVLPGTAHLPALEAPERTGRRVAAFLKERAA